jgi:2-polyprenyl-3-methyl-5-hydroxy-6-metoxy-1,4-benzoquinol methylase
LKAYVLAEEFIKGDVLEVGCGEGRGVSRLIDKAKTFTALDKIEGALQKLTQQFPQGKFIAGNFPPFAVESGAYDVVISFQVIEHIRDDNAFLKEIHRVLKPGGIALITTPNRSMSLTRNPWHEREYTGEELLKLSKTIFLQTEMKGVTGNAKVMEYHEQNRKSVDRYTRWDILDLQHRLPSAILRLPYEILNRMNRKKLQAGNNELVNNITHNDYLMTDDFTNCLDLFLKVRK